MHLKIVWEFSKKSVSLCVKPVTIATKVHNFVHDEIFDTLKCCFKFEQ